MTYAIIPVAEFNELCGKVANMESMLIALTEPKGNEPDPNELWSSKEIADASGLKTETITRKLRELRDRKCGDVTTKGKYLAIPYKYIPKLELRYFKP